MRKSKKNKNNRVKRVDIRLTEGEYQKLMKEFDRSHFYKKSEFLRLKLFGKEIVEDHTRQYKALLEAAKMNTTLIRLGANINQLVKGVNTYSNTNLTDT